MQSIRPSQFFRLATTKCTSFRNVHLSIATSMSGRHQQQLEKEVSSSSRLNHVLANANRILMSTEQNDQNLQNLITEEVMVITQILQKLVGTNFSLSEIQKLYENESSSDHFIRGLIVLLISKAASSSSSSKTQIGQQDISTIQWRLAKIVEMIHMAVLIHRQIRNVSFNTLDSGSIETQLNLQNKISVLYGDFLWAKAWKELADMGDIQVIDMMVSVLVNTSTGQFLAEIESHDLSRKMKVDYWLEKNFLLNACLPAFGCRSTLKLAGVDERLQKNAYDFGQNFGFFSKAYQEIKWFENNGSVEDSNNIHSLDICSLPVIMHSIESGQSFDRMIKKNVSENHKQPGELIMDQQEFIEIIRKGTGLQKSRSILENFRQKSLGNLNDFPESEAKVHLKSILETMDP
ncbi:Decaprenyl-diphosphate synthase subunit 2 [Dermatophagoides pteronyssinus]|uniref:Decaprenyl-diphosphate synthase subunit 2 n=1 Tax=Dermatophagoides pteronyssinus TaxID=6956 RepID=A0ABQ8IZ29_DERPT|nr:Decaprenyl-diphosphate synthase subunit 2 [Dermatophagoides pteronyssinus]